MLHCGRRNLLSVGDVAMENPVQAGIQGIANYLSKRSLCSIHYWRCLAEHETCPECLIECRIVTGRSEIINDSSLGEIRPDIDSLLNSDELCDLRQSNA